MATVTSQLIVRLIDGVTGPANAAARSLRGLNSAAAAGGVIGQYQRSLADMAGAAVSLREHTTKAATFGAPMAAGLGYAAKLAFDFEKAGNFLEALGDASASQRAEFEKFANVLNEKYPQSLGEIIRTGNELLKAGLSYSQMMGAIDQTLATAILGDMKPSEVATMISAALNAFQLPKETTEQAIKSTTLVTDRMTYAAVKSTASLRDMGEMFKYVAAGAAATGNSIDDVTAMAMAFSANKINGSEAGVALRSAITRLATGGTQKGREALARAGMNLNDYVQGKSQVTPDRVASGLLAGGIDITPIRAQVEALMQDPALVNAPIKLAAKISQLIQENITKFGGAVDAATIAENVQESIISAGSKIDLMRFFGDLKAKLASGALSMGDIAKILEGRHFARYQALLQAGLNKLKAQIQNDSAGYTQSRYKIVLKGIVGAFYELTAALEGLSVAFGRAVFPEVAAGLKRISDAAKGLSETNPAILKMIAAFAEFLIVLGPLGLLMTWRRGLDRHVCGGAEPDRDCGHRRVCRTASLGSFPGRGRDRWHGLDGRRSPRGTAHRPARALPDRAGRRHRSRHRYDRLLPARAAQPDASRHSSSVPAPRRIDAHGRGPRHRWHRYRIHLPEEQLGGDHRGRACIRRSLHGGARPCSAGRRGGRRVREGPLGKAQRDHRGDCPRDVGRVGRGCRQDRRGGRRLVHNAPRADHGCSSQHRSEQHHQVAFSALVAGWWRGSGIFPRSPATARSSCGRRPDLCRPGLPRGRARTGTDHRGALWLRPPDRQLRHRRAGGQRGRHHRLAGLQHDVQRQDRQRGRRRPDPSRPTR
ncbi:MAG: phage tail tape measure protein [Hyphomicrobiaceae bacterium]